ncbi:MAG TPA: radical SAM protein [Candidatus Avacidaminococcus intestinavium]|uniref:Radical SAM protein n=1 Tax=Candidatus Avacidaminococcus intestinavium TaxID=2840684 RepID=A0A9D1SL17_9FIRM|nr:radical SAM protein [Candidatus Avacidaminococcus intestinavium]
MKKVVPIFIPHAGCPHLCVFCNQKKISGQKEVSLRAVELQIIRYLKWIKPSLSNEIAFYGGSFTALPLGLQTSLLMIGAKYIKNGYAGSIRISTRPDYIDEKIANFLKENHVRVIELGVQSLDDTVLANAERGHTAQQAIDAVNLLKREGFKVGMQLMVGLEDQSFESIIETVKITVALQPDIARIYPVLVIRDTALADKFTKGLYKPLSLEEAVRQAHYINEKLTKAEINVIRIGLQADTELCAEGNIIAGPFHPSFGELVKSFAYREMIAKQLLAVKETKQAICILCPPKILSQVKGLKKCNQIYWESLLPGTTLKIIADKSKTEPIITVL